MDPFFPPHLYPRQSQDGAGISSNVEAVGVDSPTTSDSAASFLGRSTDPPASAGLTAGTEGDSIAENQRVEPSGEVGTDGTGSVPEGTTSVDPATTEVTSTEIIGEGEKTGGSETRVQITSPPETTTDPSTADPAREPTITEAVTTEEQMVGVTTMATQATTGPTTSPISNEAVTTITQEDEAFSRVLATTIINVDSSGSTEVQRIQVTVTVDFPDTITSSIPSTLTSLDTQSYFTTTFVTDGSTIVTTMPTAFSSDSSDRGRSLNRAAVIGGATGVAVLLLIILIGMLFVYKRAQKRRITFKEALKMEKKRAKGAGGAGLLDSEFDDDDREQMRYRDHPPSPLRIHTSGVPTPPPRVTPTVIHTDSGNVFHELEVWPPPLSAGGNGGDVMGPRSPSASRQQQRERTDSDTSSIVLDPFHSRYSRSSVYFEPSSPLSKEMS